MVQEPVVPEPRLPRAVVRRYALGSVGTGGFATLPGLVLIFYRTDTLAVAAWVAGLIVTLVRVWDVLIDPVIGAHSDAALVRCGTRARAMVVGALALPVLFVATFAVPPGTGAALAALWVGVAYLAASTAFSLFQVPYIALPAELTGDYDERSRLLGWRVAVLSLAILAFGGLGPLLRDVGTEYTGYLLMAAVAGLTIGAGLLISTRVAPRMPPGAAGGVRAAGASGAMAAYRAGLRVLRRSAAFRVLLLAFALQAVATGAMLAGANYVAVWVMESELALSLLFAALIAPAIALAPLWGRLAYRIGKKRSFTWASLAVHHRTLALVASAFAPGAWMYLPVALAGGAYAGMQAMPMAMLPDVIGDDAARHGEDVAGVFGGVWTAVETTGMALGAAALTVVLTMTGYVETSGGVTVTQPAPAVVGIALSFSLLPAVLTAASLLPLWRYRIDARARMDDDASKGRP